MRVTILDLDQPTRYQYNDDILEHIVKAINEPKETNKHNLVWTDPLLQTLEKACAIMSDAKIEGRSVTVEIKYIDTPMGKLLQEIINQTETPLAYSICGLGTLSEADYITTESYQFKGVVVDVT